MQLGSPARGRDIYDAVVVALAPPSINLPVDMESGLSACETAVSFVCLSGPGQLFGCTSNMVPALPLRTDARNSQTSSTVRGGRWRLVLRVSMRARARK
jgi:hypothetical protein